MTDKKFKYVLRMNNTPVLKTDDFAAAKKIVDEIRAYARRRNRRDAILRFFKIRLIKLHLDLLWPNVTRFFAPAIYTFSSIKFIFKIISKHGFESLTDEDYRRKAMVIWEISEKKMLLAPDQKHLYRFYFNKFKAQHQNPGFADEAEALVRRV